ncbi:MAG: MFS transporter [Sulfurovum sp.]|nr:MFS transporter [Sulfurovum sp.]MDD3500722.1 MFS transporter [Sulfurovum sp.]
MKKRSIYAWALYDWANSAYVTTVIAGFFPIVFKEYFSAHADATVSTAQLGFANSLSSLLIVLMAPLLGAIADVGGLKKRFLFLFSYLGILMSVALAFVGEGAWEAALFIYILGNLGFMGSNIFYDSLLPAVAKEKTFDAVSGLGFALGYLGGVCFLPSMSGSLWIRHGLVWRVPSLRSRCRFFLSQYGGRSFPCRSFSL